MKKLLLPVLIFFFSVTYSISNISFAQDDDDGNTSDSVTSPIVDPVSEFVFATMKTVNEYWLEMNDIKATGTIKINTRAIDETADIESVIRKKDDLYFKIDGPLGIDVGAGHFNRKKFVFCDYINEKCYTGTTNNLNISSLTKISVSFDELMNIIAGGARIRKYTSDSVWYTEEGDDIVLQFMSAKNTYRKFYVDKTTMLVKKFIYMNAKRQVVLNVEYANFVYYGNGAFAKTIYASRPFKGESFIIQYETFMNNNPYISFNVSVPGDFRRVTLK